MEKQSEKFLAILSDLVKMVEVDQTMRNRCRTSLDEWDESIDHRNTERMKDIIDEIGWPSISKVGKAGSSNAWLLVQHADHDLDFQKKCLELMKLEAEGEVSKRDIAYLEDRILTGQGMPQSYGTQFYTNSDGQLVPLPIQDPDNVDKRRAVMGLETLTENQKRMQKQYGRNII